MSSLVNIDVKDGVGATRGVIHALARHLAVQEASIDNIHGLIKGLYWYLNQVTNKNLVTLLTNIQILCLGIEQI